MNLVYRENQSVDFVEFLLYVYRKLRNNAFNNTLMMGNSIGQQLQLVDLQNNQISTITLGSGFTNTLM